MQTVPAPLDIPGSRCPAKEQSDILEGVSGSKTEYTQPQLRRLRLAKSMQ